jgi:hypothetical protein
MPINLNAIDTKALAGQMVQAGSVAFGAEWAKVRGLASSEFAVLARRIKEIAKDLAGNLYDLDHAKILLAAQRNTAVQLLVGLTTLTLLAVEAAINAVLGVIRDTVNTALGGLLLI